jgi:hypothetical protein
LIAYIPIQAKRKDFRVTEIPVKRMYPFEGVTPTKILGMRANIKVLAILLAAAFGRYSPQRGKPNE